MWSGGSREPRDEQDPLTGGDSTGEWRGGDFTPCLPGPEGPDWSATVSHRHFRPQQLLHGIAGSCLGCGLHVGRGGEVSPHVGAPFSFMPAYQGGIRYLEEEKW